MNDLNLVEMTEGQFEDFRNQACTMYAQTSPHYFDMRPDEALKLVLKDFDSRLAVDGRQTVGQYFIAIMLQKQQIGYFHFGEYPTGSFSVYGWNFHIFEKYQRNGFGKAAIELAQAYLKARGYTKVALNVMASNPTAIKLYEKFGFTVTQINMEKRID